MANTDEVILEIATPKGMFKGIFPKTTTISEVINKAANTLKLDKSDSLELVYKDKVLVPIKDRLIDFHLTGTIQLELVATGTGVCHEERN